MKMVNDDLFDRDNLSLSNWALTPRPEAVTPDSVRYEQQRNEFEREIQEYSDIIITHTDADGLSSPALIEEMTGNRAAVASVSYEGPFTLEDALVVLAENDVENRGVFILDLNPNDKSMALLIKEIVQNDCLVTWFDHHQWDDNIRTACDMPGVELHIDEDECTASLIQKTYSASYGEMMEELAEVTKDRDLWINEDPRSEYLAAFAKMAEPRDYIATVQAVGVDLPADTIERIEERLSLNDDVKDFAATRARWEEVDEYDVALTYVSGGVSSEIGNELCENRGADIAVVMHDFGGASIYSHSDRETFARCHEVAGELGGGGHPTAAGFGFEFETFRDLMIYWLDMERSAQAGEVTRAIDTVVYNQ